ncbi:hypothetical protein C1H46_021808 [Malus baccata]|uniref:Uncharacterized protein n=1 Tax=Malus baccata TaxID=106549 RepID=A0A540K2L7_MALBA|nr:hypothetical protein C1H46_021808 [Malus baccata]
METERGRSAQIKGGQVWGEAEGTDTGQRQKMTDSAERCGQKRKGQGAERKKHGREQSFTLFFLILSSQTHVLLLV